MKSKWTGRIVLALLGAAILAAFAWALREQPALVDVAAVRAGPMQVTIREDGVTRVREVYTVSTPMAGRISRTLLSEGDHVEAGKTVIAAIYPLDPPLIDARTNAELDAARTAARSGVDIAESELQRAQTALRIAREDLERAIRLRAPGVISQSALQETRNQVDLQEAAVEAARSTVAFRRAELASAEARFLQPDPLDPRSGDCCIRLYAPIDGSVLNVRTRSEQAVQAGSPIAEIGDTSDLEVVVDVLSADAVRIIPGMRALLHEWGGDRPLEARVDKIEPAAFTRVSALGIEEQRVNVLLELVEGDPRLGHGFRNVAELVVWECAQCLQVPISALFRTGNEWSAFVVEGQRLRTASLRIGNMNNEMAEVLDGLEAGDIVVVHPSDSVEAGSLVEIRQ